MNAPPRTPEEIAQEIVDAHINQIHRTATFYIGVLDKHLLSDAIIQAIQSERQATQVKEQAVGDDDGYILPKSRKEIEHVSEDNVINIEATRYLKNLCESTGEDHPGEIYTAFVEGARFARTRASRPRLILPSPNDFSKWFDKYEEENTDDPLACEAYEWVIAEVRRLNNQAEWEEE